MYDDVTCVIEILVKKKHDKFCMHEPQQLSHSTPSPEILSSSTNSEWSVSKPSICTIWGSPYNLFWHKSWLHNLLSITRSVCYFIHSQFLDISGILGTEALTWLPAQGYIEVITGLGVGWHRPRVKWVRWFVRTIDAWFWPNSTDIPLLPWLLVHLLVASSVFNTKIQWYLTSQSETTPNQWIGSTDTSEKNINFGSKCFWTLET